MCQSGALPLHARALGGCKGRDSKLLRRLMANARALLCTDKRTQVNGAVGAHHGAAAAAAAGLGLNIQRLDDCGVEVGVGP